MSHLQCASAATCSSLLHGVMALSRQPPIQTCILIKLHSQECVCVWGGATQKRNGPPRATQGVLKVLIDRFCSLIWEPDYMRKQGGTGGCLKGANYMHIYSRVWTYSVMYWNVPSFRQSSSSFTAAYSVKSQGHQFWSLRLLCEGVSVSRTCSK